MIEVVKYDIKKARQVDPTQTTALRNAFSADAKRRFKAITAAIATGVYKNDCFGLKDDVTTYQVIPPVAGAFAFTRSADKIKAFMAWLEEQVEKEILTIADIEQLGDAIESVWTNKYVYDSYKRGVIRARYEMTRAGVSVPDFEEQGGIDAYLQWSVTHLERIGVLYTRVFTDLKGITDAMDMQISRVLSQGLIDGDSPRLLARKLVGTINGTGMGDLALTDTLGRFIPAQRRAEMLARTEVIRAHHLGLVQQYRNYGVLNISVLAEFTTAGDHRVCDRCASLDGKVFTLDEIENVIPVHVNCRCTILPVIKELEKYNIK